ncbi:MAG: hypothetical protein V9H25_17980 [Candidatus Competibacter sp.]|jgi:hypothetical protein
MRQQSKESIVILFVVGALVLNYPFLDLFDRAWLPFGIPLLYLYLYLIWLAIIALLVAIVERSEIHAPERPAPPLESASRPPPVAADRGGAGGTDRPSQP